MNWLTPQWVVLGWILGTGISLFNHWIVLRSTRKMADGERTKGAKVGGAYALRYLINLAALFSTYRNPSLLLGTALGLTTVKNYLFIKYLFTKKEVK